MAALTTTAIVLGTAAVVGASVYSAYQQDKAIKKATKQQQVSMPQVPQVGEAAKVAQDTMVKRKKAIARAGSIFTSPMGLTEEAEISKKTLLGR